MKPIFESYLTYYRDLAPQNVAQLRSLAAADLHFVDPFNDVSGVEHVIKIFDDMFKRIKAPRFEILDAVESNNRLFVRWTMHFSSPLLRFGRPHQITGITVATLGKDEKISEHLDYWDASSQLYLHLPIIGWIIRLLRRFFA